MSEIDRPAAATESVQTEIRRPRLLRLSPDMLREMAERTGAQKRRREYLPLPHPLSHGRDWTLARTSSNTRLQCFIDCWRHADFPQQSVVTLGSFDGRNALRLRL